MLKALVRPNFPSARVREYERLLFRRARLAHKMVVRRLTTFFQTVGPVLDDNARQDAFPNLVSLIVEVRSVFAGSVPVNLRDLEDQADRVDRFVTRDTIRIIRTVVPIQTSTLGSPLKALHQEWALENARLITSMHETYFGRVAEAVERAVSEGRTTRQLTRDLQDAFGIGRRHARLIARDQIGTLNSRITKKRQTDLGINYYMWSTSDDDLVRETHEAKDGQIISWSNPPPDTGHAGEDINCRCGAIPMVDLDSSNLVAMLK